VITTAQLLDVGVIRSPVSKWHQKGLLHREFRGVWRFGHRALWRSIPTVPPAEAIRTAGATLSLDALARILSHLEREFRRLLREAGLSLPRCNRKQGAHYVDCRWADHRLTVELDSYRFHHSRHAWESDHERRRAARRRGDELRRFTWHDVFEDPEPMLDELEELLAHYPSVATAR
jgi:very-short-patch-repair endonuclease